MRAAWHKRLTSRSFYSPIKVRLEVTSNQFVRLGAREVSANRRPVKRTVFVALPACRKGRSTGRDQMSRPAITRVATNRLDRAERQVACGFVRCVGHFTQQRRKGLRLADKQTIRD